MPRGAVILLKDDRVALFERVIGDEVYYVFPGGRVEEGETVEDAAVREAYEELGLIVQLGSLAAVVEFPSRQGDKTQYYYWAEITGGTFGKGTGEELNSDLTSERGRYRPVWLNLNQLPENDVRPRELAEALSSNEITPGKEPLRVIE